MEELTKKLEIKDITKQNFWQGSIKKKVKIYYLQKNCEK